MQELATQPVTLTSWQLADKLDSIDAAALARHQAFAFEQQDQSAMPAKPAGDPPLVRLGQGEYARELGGGQ